MGAKRKQLAERFGYDCKNAAHLLRLLKMGAEFMRTGTLLVDRRAAGDADWLLSVKRGEWELKTVQMTAEALFAELKLAQEASSLPEAPDLRLVNELLMDILTYAHHTTINLRAHQVLVRERKEKEEHESER
jgi:hypothetical protein